MSQVRTKEGGEAKKDPAHSVAAERCVTDLAAPPGEEKSLSRAEDSQRKN
jgi:hypothetical protein